MNTIIKKSPFYTPAQIIRGYKIKKAVENGLPYKYMQQKAQYNPCRYALSGYNVTKTNKLRDAFRNIKDEFVDFVKEYFGD